MVPVEDKRSPSRHVDSVRGLTEVDSGLIFNFVWVELMESQVQSSFWCRGKRWFLRLCVFIAAPSPRQSIHVCARVVKHGQAGVSVFGHGAGPSGSGCILGLPVERSRQRVSHAAPCPPLPLSPSCRLRLRSPGVSTDSRADKESTSDRATALCSCTVCVCTNRNLMAFFSGVTTSKKFRPLKKKKSHIRSLFTHYPSVMSHRANVTSPQAKFWLHLVFV